VAGRSPKRSPPHPQSSCSLRQVRLIAAEITLVLLVYFHQANSGWILYTERLFWRMSANCVLAHTALPAPASLCRGGSSVPWRCKGLAVRSGRSSSQRLYAAGVVVEKSVPICRQYAAQSARGIANGRAIIWLSLTWPKKRPGIKKLASLPA